MTRKPSPNVMYWAVDSGVEGVVYWAVTGAVEEDVHKAVCKTVYLAVWEATAWAVLNQPSHPNLERFIGELHQFRIRNSISS